MTGDEYQVTGLDGTAKKSIFEKNNIIAGTHVVKIEDSATPRSTPEEGVEDGCFEILPDDDDADDDRDNDDSSSSSNNNNNNNNNNKRSNNNSDDYNYDNKPSFEILERIEEKLNSNSSKSDVISNQIKYDFPSTTMISPTKNVDNDQTLSESLTSSSARRKRLTGLFAPKNSIVSKSQVESSSDESSFDDDEQWLEEEAQLFDEDVDQPIDYSNFDSSLPNSFLDLPPDIYDYLDADLVRNIENQDVTTFACEHHIYIKGLLKLLAERDLIGVEDDISDKENIIKMGVLRKKQTKSGWSVKYVEVRKGNLTYFADVEHEKRRTIHLRKRTCTCQLSSTATTREGGQDFVFELLVDGGRRILWMTKSEEECLGWVRAINQGMIGEVNDSRDSPFDAILYQGSIDDYQTVQNSLKDAKTRHEYMIAMNTLLYRQTSSSALRVPMKWIRDNILKNEKFEEEPVAANERIKYNVQEYWKNLCNTTIVLNGNLIEADDIYSGERVIGALSRCILEFDKVENTQDFEQIFNSLKHARGDSNLFITELEAVSYARNILHGALQSTRRGDIEAAVQKLFRNDYVAYAELVSSEPLNVDVSYAGDDFSENRPRPSELNVGWIETKSRKSKKWKMRYFVVSEGVLSYFQRADPRPYRLVSQIVLRDAKITTLEGNMLSLDLQGQERLLRFNDRGELVRWKAIIDKGNIDLIQDQDFEKLDDMIIQEHFDPGTVSDGMMNEKPLKGVRGARAKFLKNAALFLSAKNQANKGMQRAKNATEARMKSIRSGAGLLIRGVRGNSNSSERRRPTNEMLLSSTKNLDSRNEKREPTVQAVVEMNNTFKVWSKLNENAEQKNEILL